MKPQIESLKKSEMTIPTETAKNSGLLIDDAEIKNFKASQLLAIVSSKGTNINDSYRAFEMLPDLRYAADILVSETLSPKDLAMPKMNITIDTDGLDKDLSDSKIITELNRHFGEGGYYDLESQLYKILEEALVTSGAVPLMALKKNEIDDFINARRTSNTTLSVENLKSNLAKTKLNIVKPSANKVLRDLDITITDNCNILKGCLADAYDMEMNLKELGMENAKTNYLSFVDIGRAADSQEGHPIVFKLPTESVIPVHVPGQPDKHVGYYIVCEGGYPVSHKQDSSEAQKLEKRIKDIINGSDEAYKNVITVGKSDAGKGKTDTSPKEYMDTFSSKIREELVGSLNNGIYRRELEVSSHEDAYQLMFHMTLAKKKVQVIYVPAGIMNYIAFDYDSRGIGLSLMEKNKLFTTIRASMLIADIFGAMRNSVPQTKVNVALDEDDTDHYQTIEIIKDKIAKMTGARFPVGTLSSSDILESLQKASIYLNIDGGTAFPSTRVEVEDGQRQIAKSDTDLNEELKKIHMSGMQTSPEKVDRALEGDYAISTATTNFLDARRIIQRQKIFTGHTSEFIRNYIRLSGPLRKLFVEAVGEENVEDLISRVKHTLPEADSNSLQSHLEAFEKASELIDSIVETQISEDLLRDTLQGNYLPNMLDNYRAMAAAHYKAEWLREQNIMTDILELSGDNNEVISDAIIAKLGNVIKFAGKITAKAIKEEAKASKKIDKENDAAGNGPEPAVGGGDDFGGDDPFEETPAVDPDAPVEEGGEEEVLTDTDGDGNEATTVDPEVDPDTQV